MTYEHPKHPPRHHPTITTAAVGCTVTCVCGWSSAEPSAPKAASAYQAHVADEKASEGGGS